MAGSLISTLSWGTFQDREGNALANQSPSLTNADGSTATVYQDAALTIPLAAPLTTDANGQLPGYLPDGGYILSDADLGPRPVNVLSDVSAVVAIGAGLLLDASDPNAPSLILEPEPPWIDVNTGSGISPPFENGATNLGAGFSPASFRKLHSGLVLTRGHVTCTATQVFTMPPGYWPAFAEVIPCWYGNNTPGVMIVYADGSVQFNAAPTGWATLHGWYWAT